MDVYGVSTNTHKIYNGRTANGRKREREREPSNANDDDERWYAIREWWREAAAKTHVKKCLRRERRETKAEGQSPPPAFCRRFS